jgi:8-oxo-dGTP pyrophosphatase MutT (NUDIX family)
MLSQQSLDRLAQAARTFDAAAHASFSIGTDSVGWIRRRDVPALKRWPGVFLLTWNGVAMHPDLDSAESRSRAFAEVARELARDGLVTGWRDELYAVVTAFDAPPLARMERAAARFFGIRTFAAHANGIVRMAGETRMWIARRSRSKPIDPGLLDNLVGGGLTAGADVRAELVREAREEAGMPEALARQAVRRGCIDILREVPEGVQQETLFAFDLELPPDFVPRNEDGEVAEVRLMSLDEVSRVIGAGEMTLDASLVAAGYLARAATQ